MERWWINGQPGRLVDITDRGFMYGDGLFETIAVRAGQPRFLALHLDRLLTGCGQLHIAAPARAALGADVAAAASGVAHGTLKVVITRGSGPRGYGIPAAAKPTVIWGIAESQPQIAQPIRVRWCETMVSVNPATAGLKTLGRLEQVMARAEWDDPEVAEGLMTSTTGLLSGGTSSNVFLVAGDRLLTPTLHSAAIAGVMRRVVIEAAAQAGIAVAETELAPAALHAAAEVFVSNALTGIRPVCRLDARAWSHGPVTRQLQMLLAAAGVGECAGVY